MDNREQMRSMNMRDAEKVLLQIRQLLNDLNIIFFLRHGTCLGAVRDRELIPWDDDIDIGSIIGMNNLDEESIYKTVNDFRAAGFEVKILQTNFHIGVELSKSGIPIDWTCYRIIEENIFQYPAIKIPVHLYKNLKPVCLLGEAFFVPNPPEEYLTLKYGPEWRVPKKMDFQGDIIDSISESAIIERSGISSRILKFLFPNKNVTRIQVLNCDMQPIEKMEVTVVGVGRQTTDHNGYAKFYLLNQDYYAMTIGSRKEREILYEEILRPGGEYRYVQNLNQRSGRIHVLTERIK
tara:strand:+ start:576 stop:1454 length:879 start_codon:yes stop_codon:yes gene_type:complete